MPDEVPCRRFSLKVDDGGMTALKFNLSYDADLAKTDPFAIRKTAAEIERSFEEFPRDVRRRLEDTDSEVDYVARRPGDRQAVLSVETRDTEAHALAVIEATCRSRGLAGQRSV